MLKGSAKLQIVRATETQIPLILSFISKLAAYEKLTHQVTATEEDLRQSLFGPRPAAEVVFAYLDDTPVGFAIYFSNFSTFLGKAGIYLEDLFVDLEHRGQGVGKAILRHLAKLALERDGGRLEWAVLDWNEPAINFYKKLGATLLHDWRICRVTGTALNELADEAAL